MKTLCAVIVLILSISFVFFFHTSDPIDLCELDKCPKCYGRNLCDDFKSHKFRFSYDTLHDLFTNWFSVKNLYFAYYGDTKVVLKKLAHSRELRALDDAAILGPVDDLINFKTCDDDVRADFFAELGDKFTADELETILRTNVEPLLLHLFSSDNGWPVPKLFGACGRLIVEEYSGVPLNNLRDFDWFVRAYLALQLLQASVNFTDAHPTFRLYLTDISPDNIVVDQDFKISFIDLENAILAHKSPLEGGSHYSQHFYGEDGYGYNKESVCSSGISDHNIYAICQSAPWPMMANGLLHSPPFEIEVEHTILFQLIENCVDSHGADQSERFKITEKIIDILNGILYEGRDEK